MKSEPSGDRLRILFLCHENACRSQMAEAFALELGRGRVEASSAGSRPRGIVDEMAVAVMAERGIDLQAHRSKGLEEVPREEFDCVVTMGCGDECPWIPVRPGGRRIEREIPDPDGQPIETFRKVRDSVEESVSGLLTELLGPEAHP